MSNAPTTRAFDAHAPSYEKTWGLDPVARAMRAEVHRAILAHAAAGCRVLDVGCGPGIDARWLLDQGFRVVAVDASVGMVEGARQAVVGLEVHVDDAAHLDTITSASVDAALLDFGVVNCVELDLAGRALARVVVPGGLVFVVTMPRVAPAWTIVQLAGLHWGAALRRSRPRVDLVVEGVAVPTRYDDAADIRLAWSAWFEVIDQQALGLVLPPPRSRGSKDAVVRALVPLERALCRRRVLRGMGDHVLLVLRRKSAG